MHVTKIKIKQDRVFVEYDKAVIVEEKELLNKYSIDSPEQPVGAFKEAFQKMDFFLIELCELADQPKDVPVMCEDVNITGLSFKYKDGELLSAIITGTKALAYSNSPLVLNTPNKSVCDDEFDKMQHLTDPCIAGLKAVLEHAEQYVNGERLQIEMEFDDDKISEVGPAMRGDTTEKSKEADPEKFDSHKPEVDPNAGKGDETVTPKDDQMPVRKEVDSNLDYDNKVIGDRSKSMLGHSENLGPEANVSKDVRDDSEDGLQDPPL